MSKFQIAKRKNPPKYAFTVFIGDMTEDEKNQFEVIILKDKKYWSESNSVENWYDIYCIDGEYYSIGHTEGHRNVLQNFLKCCCPEDKKFHEEVNS